MATYYNEYEPYAAEWLRNLIKKGLIPNGEVDTRSIINVSPDDLRGFTQCHFFAGLGGWAYAGRLAGWPDDRPLWTGSAPCQPFSTAGQQKGQADERHLWPHFFRLIRACRPRVIMGEQVAAAVGKDWLDGVCADLESLRYSCGAVVVPACAVNAPHRRDRLWFVADADKGRWGWRPRDGECVGDGADAGRSQDQCDTAGGGEDCLNVADAGPYGSQEPIHGSQGAQRERGLSADCGQSDGHWDTYEWALGSDGQARRVEPSIRLLAHGVPARVGKLRAYGNAIVPQVAAEVIAAYMEAYGA